MIYIQRVRCMDLINKVCVCCFLKEITFQPFFFLREAEHISLLCLHPLPPALPPDRKRSPRRPRHRERAGLKSVWCALTRRQAAITASSPAGAARSSSKGPLKVRSPETLLLPDDLPATNSRHTGWLKGRGHRDFKFEAWSLQIKGMCLSQLVFFSSLKVNKPIFLLGVPQGSIITCALGEMTASSIRSGGRTARPAASASV